MATQLQLWSGTLSPFSAKVRMVLAEKHIRAKVTEIPWHRDTLWGPKPDAFLAVSPRGEVPVLEVQTHGQTPLAIVDSTVIIEYLEEAYPEHSLMPGTPLERAACRMWEDQADQVMAKEISVLIREVFLKPDGQGRDEAAVASASAFISGYYGALNTRLTGREFLCGAFTTADIATFVCLGFARSLGMPPGPEHQEIEAWSARVYARPAIKAEFDGILAVAAMA